MDYEKIKEGIDKRKTQMSVEQPTRQMSGGNKDHFLHELLESVNTKRPTTESVKKLRTLTTATDRAAETKRRQEAGLPPKQYNDNDYVPPAPERRTESYNEPRLSEAHLKERDDLFEQNLNNQKSKGFSDEVAKYMGNNNGYNNHQYPQQGQYNYPQGQPQSPNILIEQATNITHQFMNENFAGIVHEAMKSTIVEEYKQERVNKALRENREIIKEIVIDIIKEIQSKSKKK